MKFNKHILKLTLLMPLFISFCFMGCLSTLLGQGPPRPAQPASVGLTLQPGESCNYTASDRGISFDVTFHVTKTGEASFKRIAVKSANVNYVHEGGSWSVVGGNIQITMFDLKIEINPVAAKVCVGERCFVATIKPRNKWRISQLPFPEKNRDKPK